MKILTVFTNPNPKSFCHAVLRQSNKGLEEADHAREVVELNAIRFIPVFRTKEYKSAWEVPMTCIIDDWGLRYPEVKKVEYIYFYQVPATYDATRRGTWNVPTHWARILPINY